MKLNSDLANKIQSLIPNDSKSFAVPVVDLFLRHLNAPLEVAVLPGNNLQMPIPNLAFSTQFNLDLNDFKRLVEQLAFASPEVILAENVDDRGRGKLMISSMTVYFQFDDSSGRFDAIAGISPSLQSLTDMFNLKKLAVHPMIEAEREVDEETLGYFLWLNAAELIIIAKQFDVAEQLAEYEWLGISQLQELSLGVGTSAGKGRLILQGKFNQTMPLLPEIRNEFLAKSVGKPDTFISSSLPNVEKIEQWIALIESAISTDVKGKARVKITKALGFDVVEIFSFLGPEVAYYSDSVGDFLSIKVRKGNLLDTCAN